MMNLPWPKLRNRRLYGVLLIALVLLAGILVFWGAFVVPPERPVRQGRLDLSGMALDDRTSITLNGDWEFYWNQLLDAADFSGSARQPDFYGNVPDVWNHYRLSGEPLPAFGCATYRLLVTGAEPDVPLMLRIDSASTAYRMFIDDRLVAANGRVASTPEQAEPFNQPRSVIFSPSAQEFSIILQVSNFTYARGGLWFKIDFGREAAVKNLLEQILYKDALLLGCILIMALYHLNLFVLLHQVRTALLFFLLDMNMIARILVYGEYLLLKLFPAAPYRLLVECSYLTLIWGPVLFFFLVMDLFFRDFGRTWLNRLVLGYGCLASVAVLALPIHVFTGWLLAFEAAMAVILVLTIAAIARAAREGRSGTLAMLVAGSVSAVLILHDVLYQQNYLFTSYGELASFGLAFLLFTISVLMASQILESRRENRQLEGRLLLSQQIEQRLKRQVGEIMKTREALLNERPGYQEALVIADDEALRARLVQLLGQHGYSASQNGVTGDFDWLMHGNPADVVILDTRSAAVSGFEMLSRIRQQFTPVELPVLLLVDRENVEEAATGFWLGANDTIGRPFSAEELVARVRNLFQMQSWVRKTVTSELSFLQAQIKPHFLFNALSVIASRCLKAPAEARDLLLDLSDYLRGSFDFDSRNDMTTLSRELSLVKAYLEIEQARFQERLDARFEIDPEADGSLPVLSIQPIVENAIRHGLMPRAAGGTILVQVERNAEAITVSVLDNGIGMNPEQVRRVMSAASDRRGIGLWNIHRRLLALYGKGLLIHSEPGRGTRVGFEIPLQP